MATLELKPIRMNILIDDPSLIDYLEAVPVRRRASMGRMLMSAGLMAKKLGNTSSVNDAPYSAPLAVVEPEKTKVNMGEMLGVDDLF